MDLQEEYDDDMQVDHSDVTLWHEKWPYKAALFPSKASKNESGLPGISDLFTLHIIDMWQGLRTNQIALFHLSVVHPVFLFCYDLRI